MPDDRRIDEPAPNTAGPRPDGGPGGKVNVPQGIEQLLALAVTNAEWRAKVLADPLKAADEAKVGLSDSERNILKSISHRSLRSMVEAFAQKRGFPWVKVTVGVSAAALLAAGVVVPSLMASPRGIRPDVPPPNPNKPAEGSEAPAALWLASLEDALAQAKKTNSAVMAVFPHPKPIGPLHISYEDGTSGLEVGPEWKSQKVISSDSKEFRVAVKNADLVAVRVAKPLPVGQELKKAGIQDIEVTEKEAEKIRDAEKKKFEAYEAALKKYGLEEKTLPAVVFLAPDGSELSKLVQPEEEAKLIEAIKVVPPQLAKWLNDQSKEKRPAPAQWSWGHRP